MLLYRTCVNNVKPHPKVPRSALWSEVSSFSETLLSDLWEATSRPQAVLTAALGLAARRLANFFVT
jgi:hypothetical protein